MAKKILFVEDEPEIIDLMKLRLEPLGYELIAAFDGEEGLKKAFAEKPDLILLDVIMPKIDGLTVCRNLKTNPQTKDIPIVIVTASGGKELAGRCQQAGADDLIRKPFEAKELIDKVNRFLSKPAQ